MRGFPFESGWQWLGCDIGGAKELGVIYFATNWGAKEPQNLPNHRVDGEVHLKECRLTSFLFDFTFKCERICWLAVDPQTFTLFPPCYSQASKTKKSFETMRHLKLTPYKHQSLGRIWIDVSTRHPAFWQSAFNYKKNREAK